MAVTEPTDVDTSIPEFWAKRILREHRYGNFWERFVGSAIVHQSELLNGPGDLIHIQVTDPLSGAGVTGDTATLEGNEEDLSTTEIKVSPLLYRHAVRNNRRAAKKSIVDLMEETRMRLSEWGGNKMDSVRFSLFTADALPAPLASETYTPNVYVIGGGTDADDVTAGDDLTVADIQVIKLTLEEQKAKPIVVDGEPVYVYVCNPRALFRLKRESEYRDWVREAHVRGADNPFFKGATAMIDGMVIFGSFNSTIAANATSVPVNRGIAFGAEAFVEGLDENVHSTMETFDYKLQMGVSYEFAFQPRRALELSSLQVFAEAPAPSAA